MSVSAPSLAALERQLEGRWAWVERARERDAALLGHLGAFSWQLALRTHPGLLREAREQEAPLQEVLTYVEQRSRQEQWPHTHPGLVRVRELHRRRARLVAMMCRRLSLPGGHAPEPFLTLVEQLEALALAPVPELPSPKELVVLRQSGWVGLMPGHLWLTLERVVWWPWRGEPVQVRLASLEARPVALVSAGFGVEFEGERRWAVTTWRRAGPLARLIDLCRQLPQPGHDASPVRELAVSQAYSRHLDYESERRWGVAVFLPEYVAFLPTHRLSPLEHLGRLVGREVRCPTPSDLLWQQTLVEQLRRLPAEQFESALRALVRSRDGWLWSSHEVHRAPEEEGELRLERGAQLLGIEGAKWREVVQPFLQRHLPFASAPSTRRPRRGVWRELLRERLAMVVGILLCLPPFHALRGGEETVFSLAGRGLLVWAGMRHVKAKGHPPWVGLIFSFSFFPMTPFVLFFTKLKQPSRRSPD